MITRRELIVRGAAGAAVLGSSLAEIGFDANDPSLTDGGRRSTTTT